MRRFSVRSVQVVTLVGVVTAALVGAVGPSAAWATAPRAAHSASTAAAAVVGPSAGTYQAVGPTRILDTGAGTGAPKAAVGARKTLTVQVSGRGDVPASGVAAVVLNVTVAAPSAGGFITAYPAGVTRPATSSLNFTSGRAVPDLVVVRLGTGGKVSLYNGSDGTVRLVADVSGYYASGSSTQPGAFTSLAPARILDTGAGTGAPKAAVKSHATLTFQVTGKGGVLTSGVSSVVLNVTAAGTTGTGYVTAYPAGTTRPTTSSLNFTAGRTIANSVVARVGAGGKVSLYNGSTGTVRLIADVSGYFRSGTAAQPGAFTSVGPIRVLDTGAGTGAPKAPVQSFDGATFTMAGHGGVPSTGVSAVVLNVTVAAETAGGYITAAPGNGQPRTSNLNFQAGHSVANLVVVRLRPDGQINLFNHSLGTVRLIADVAGYYQARPPFMTWNAPITDTNDDHGFAGQVSCPTATFCAAIANTGQVTTYDGSVWSAPTVIDSGVQLTSLSCPSATFCVAVGDHDAITFNGTTWTKSAIDAAGGLTAVSCGSSTRCVAVDSVVGAQFFDTTGHAFVDNAGTWTATTVDATGFTAVSCPSGTYCGAGDDDGDFFSFDGSSWTTPGGNPLDFGGPTQISCTSSTFCAALNNDPDSVQTYDGATWSDPSGIDTQTALAGLSCLSPTFCEAGTDDIGVSTFNGTTWSTPTSVVDFGSAFNSSISCATTTFCVLLTNDGYASTGHDTSWSAIAPVAPSKGFPEPGAVSCPTTVFCVATTNAGYGDVFDGKSWQDGQLFYARHDLRTVSCVSSTFCLAASDDGMAVTWNGTSASAPLSDHLASHINARVSCATTTFCVAEGGGQSATYNGSTWSAAISMGSIEGADIACPALNLCIGVAGQQWLSFNGTAWSVPKTLGTGEDSFSALSCPTTTFCLATGVPVFNAQGGNPGGEDYAAFNGTTWTGPLSADSGGWVSDVSCASSTFCVGTELDGTTVSWDGGVWTDPLLLDEATDGEDGPDVSCPVIGSCFVFGQLGTYVGSDD